MATPAGIHRAIFPIAIPNAVPTPAQIVMLSARPSGNLGIVVTRGASIHEHFHPQEEVYEVIEGELEVTIDGMAQIARTGLVAIVPGNVRHSVKALTAGNAIIVDYPLRREFV